LKSKVYIPLLPLLSSPPLFSSQSFSHASPLPHFISYVSSNSTTDNGPHVPHFISYVSSKLTTDNGSHVRERCSEGKWWQSSKQSCFHPSIHPSINQSIYLSIYLSISHPLYLSMPETEAKHVVRRLLMAHGLPLGSRNGARRQARL